MFTVTRKVASTEKKRLCIRFPVTTGEADGGHLPAAERALLLVIQHPLACQRSAPFLLAFHFQCHGFKSCWDLHSDHVSTLGQKGRGGLLGKLSDPLPAAGHPTHSSGEGNSSCSQFKTHVLMDYYGATDLPPASSSALPKRQELFRPSWAAPASPASPSSSPARRTSAPSTPKGFSHCHLLVNKILPVSLLRSRYIALHS